MREIESEEQAAKAALGTMQANSLTSAVISVGGVLWGAIEIDTLTEGGKRLAKEFWNGPTAEVLVRVLGYRLPLRTAASAYVSSKTERLVRDAAHGGFDLMLQVVTYRGSARAAAHRPDAAHGGV